MSLSQSDTISELYPADVTGEVSTADELISERRNVRAVYDMTADTGPNEPASGSPGGWTIQALPPVAGELNQYQVAELVAGQFQEHTIGFKEKGGQGTTPGTLEHELEVVGSARDANTRILKSDADNEVGFNRNNNHPTSTPLDIDSRVGSSGFIEAQKFAGRLMFSRGIAGSAFNDTVNGTGGGSDMKRMGQGPLINFRKEFGRGPLLDHDERVVFNNRITWEELDNIIISIKASVLLIWDVFEYERGELKEVPGGEGTPIGR